MVSKMLELTILEQVPAFELVELCKDKFFGISEISVCGCTSHVEQ